MTASPGPPRAPPCAARPESNRLTLLGRNLPIGRRRRLFLSNARWRRRLPEVERVLVDPAIPANAAAGWAIAEAPEQWWAVFHPIWRDLVVAPEMGRGR